VAEQCASETRISRILTSSLDNIFTAKEDASDDERLIPGSSAKGVALFTAAIRQRKTIAAPFIGDMFLAPIVWELQCHL